MKTNAIYSGDCKDVLQNFPEKGKPIQKLLKD